MRHPHPIDFIESLLSENGSIAEVQTSVYRYHPQSLWDDRTVYKIGIADLRTHYERLVEQLQQEQDLAFDSIVKMDNDTYRHFPLVDFTTPDSKRVGQAANLLVTEYRASRAALVHSGRSYHLYMGVLLSHESWVKFMGRILLLNLRDEPPTVDQRWVGHRLIGGYGSLRWSAKTSPLLPQVIQEWSNGKIAAPAASGSHTKNSDL